MISFTKDVLNIDKLHSLLIDRLSAIIKDVMNQRVKLKDFQEFSNFKIIVNDEGIEMTCDLKMIDRDVIHYSLISVTNDSNLKFFDDGSIMIGDIYKLPSITINDLLDLQVVNESDVSYLVAHDEYDMYDKIVECQLLGIYSSFENLNKSNVLKLNKQLDVYVVKTNTDLDAYFGQD